MSKFSPTRSVLMAPIHAARYGVGFLRKGYIYQSKTGARFAKRSEYRDFLSPGHTGLLLDGHRLHLSERESFQNVCVIARVESGAERFGKGDILVVDLRRVQTVTDAGLRTDSSVVRVVEHRAPLQQR